MISFPQTDIEYAMQEEIDSLKKEIERLKVIEAAHHRVIDALWGGKYWTAVGKEWGRIQSETSYPLENYTQYAI
jgi:hypothetical protein